MNYTINASDTTTAYIHDGSVIDTIFTTLPGVNTFIFDKGNYYLNDALLINKNNIVFKSAYCTARDVHIFQNNSQKDSIVINNCNGTKLIGISIHNTHVGKIALTLASVNYSLVESCNIYGNSDTFSVYYAGPKNLTAGQSTLSAYTNKELDNINVFRKNVVYAKWSGDSVSFSLQKNSNFTDNIIRGGKVAVYMCSGCAIENNIIYDSTTNGIYLSFPSDNITIANNKIYECQASAIKMANQVEHGPFTPFNYSIKVSDNKIYDAKFYAIELNYAREITIIDNNFVSTDIYGIYCYQCHNIRVTGNTISYFTVGVWFEAGTNIYIYYNKFNSVYPDESNNVVKMVQSSNGAINDNLIHGNIKYDIFAIDNTNTNIDIGTNPIKDYYTYNEETQLLKI